ncbi:MAG: fgs [Firmicutes bacterium]|nr:fgs [Bacillota bacterium]
MTYEQALEYLASLGKFGINLGLSRIEKLLALMQNPERRYKIVHITGTNGKGSTTAMVGAMLEAAGIKTAMYTSPHLTDYTERMVINGEQISHKAFGEVIRYTSTFVSDMVKAGWEHPTEFEVLTAAALYYFAAAGVEYAVIEVGLGGLLDSTNVVSPEIAVITNVSLEHTDRCGSTVAEIAQHKAGIIKRGIPVVTAAKAEALAVIKAVANQNQAKLYIAGVDFTGELSGFIGKQQLVTVQAKHRYQLPPLAVNLLGKHQVENTAVAVMAMLALADKEPRITSDTIENGLKAAQWPGRFEIFPGKPLIVIDGAHNPAGAQALRLTLDEIFPDKIITFVLGILADKDVANICRALVRQGDKVITVEPMSDRAADPKRVAEQITVCQVEIGDSIEAGIERAVAKAGEDGLVCVAGSLYLIGTARPIIFSRQNNLLGI